MAGVCAGSAGGSQPPHGDPYRLASGCEADPILDLEDEHGEEEQNEAERRHGRSFAKGHAIARRMAELGGRIPAYFDVAYGTYQAIGPDANNFKTQLGIEVRNACYPRYKSWKAVPLHERATVDARMDEIFIIPRDNPILNDRLEAYMGRLYSLWKNRLATAYNNDGPNQPPPDNTSLEKWRSFVEYYSSSDVQKKSKNNSKSRKSNPFTSLQGRTSMSELRTKNVVDPSTQPPSVPARDAWLKTKQRRDGSWVDDSYRSSYGRIKEKETELVQRLSQSGESSCPGSDSGSQYRLTPDDEIAVMESVLKPRRDFTPGIGRRTARTVRSSPGSACSSSSTRAPPLTDEHRREIDDLRAQMAAQMAAQAAAHSEALSAAQAAAQAQSAAAIQHVLDIVRHIPGVVIPDDQISRFFSGGGGGSGSGSGDVSGGSGDD